MLHCNIVQCSKTHFSAATHVEDNWSALQSTAVQSLLMQCSVVFIYLYISVFYSYDKQFKDVHYVGKSHQQNQYSGVKSWFVNNRITSQVYKIHMLIWLGEPVVITVDRCVFNTREDTSAVISLINDPLCYTHFMAIHKTLSIWLEKNYLSVMKNTFCQGHML